MKNETPLYYDVHGLPLNTSLLFYVYIFLIIIISNILPVSCYTYFFSFLLGISGILIFFIKPSGKLLISDNTLRLLLKSPFHLSLLTLKIHDITFAEEAEIYYKLDPYKLFFKNLRRLNSEEEKCIKLSTVDGKIYSIPSRQSKSVVAALMT